jgi:hypothetical protein
MNVRRFIETVREQWENFEEPTFPKNRKLKHITDSQVGMATENTGFLLNYAVSLMEEGECYLEVGTWKGRTLSYAMEGNADKEFFAVDNFSQFTKRPRWYRPFSEPEPRRSLNRVLRNASRTHRVSFLEGDFRTILPEFSKTVGVYFYDGGHSFQDQYEGLELGLAHMAPDSLIVVDDTNPFEEGVNGSEARSANDKWLREHPDWQLLFDLLSPRRDVGWHNGIQVFGRLATTRHR